MKLNLLFALAAGVGALVGPQPQLKKVQSRSFAPATLDVCDDIEMRVDVIIEGKFHHRFYKCHDAWERRLKNKRLERDALNRENGANPLETNDATVQNLNGEINSLKQILAVSCAVLERDLRFAPTVEEFRAEAWMSCQAGMSWATNELTFEHGLAAIAGTGKTLRCLGCDVEAVDLRRR